MTDRTLLTVTVFQVVPPALLADRAARGDASASIRTSEGTNAERTPRTPDRANTARALSQQIVVAKSAAFGRIHRDVMQIVAAIPAGRVATFADIGAFLGVVPRQVAFLLARQNDPARESAPWHRVVADDGSLGRPKHDAWGRSQRELLEAEGIAFNDKQRVVGLTKRRFVPTTRNTGVTPTPRPSGERARSAR